jgi:hypothetical protein
MSGALFFAAVNTAFSSMFSIIFLFPSERAIVLKERASRTFVGHAGDPTLLLLTLVLCLAKPAFSVDWWRLALLLSISPFFSISLLQPSVACRYHVGSYFLSKSLMELPRTMISVLIFSAFS